MAARIGRYEIIRKIGAGSTATVYLAESGAGQVALKVLHKQLVLDEVIMERFRREVALARELEHDTIVRIYDFVSWEEQAAIVMEHCAGGNLADWSSADPDQAAALARRIAQALAFAHGRGIIHRDIKPENILKTADCRIKLCDFGSAHVQNLLGLTTSTMFAGTPRYIAPELLAGNSSDSRSDLYSLGAVLYQVVTGKPHRDTSVISLLRKQEAVAAPADLVPGFPAWFSAIIMNLLDDIEKRIPDAETLLYLLENKQAPGTRKVKTCLYCKSVMAEETTLCLDCGKPELILEPYTGKDARGLVLTKITENAPILHHFISLLKALAGLAELEMTFIVGDARMYSKEERKQGVRMPVRVLDNLSDEMSRELILLLKGPYPKEIRLEARSMHQVVKIKRGPLIRPRAGVIRYETAEHFLSRAAQQNRQLVHTAHRELFTGIAEAGYRILARTAAAGLSENTRELLNRLMDSIQSALQQLHTIETDLNSVSISGIYNEWMRVSHMLAKSEQPGETQALIERKLEQQRLYERCRQQELKYTGLKNKILEISGKMAVLAGQDTAAGRPPEDFRDAIAGMIDSMRA